MNIETINKWLDEEYGCSYTRLEELHDFYFEKYCDLKKENKQLKETYKEIFNNYQKLKKENEEVTSLNLHQVDKIQQLKEQLLVAHTNEETFRLEMEDITKALGLDKDTLFDDVKVCVKSLKDNWNKLKKDLELVVDYGLGDESSKWDKIYGEYAKSTLKFMQELEQGSDSNE